MAGTLRALILTHGAGSNAESPLLVAVEGALTRPDLRVLRFTLPFRQMRPHGPPFAGDAARDRAGLKQAIQEMRSGVPGAVLLGGHSYGGRQATILAAEEPGLVDGLFLLSYPLHPPRRAAELRTAHFPNLRTPALFVHGTRDPFGSIEEMRQALALIPARAELAEIGSAGHDLKTKGATPAIVEAFERFFSV
jgi:predicted alpha/beta-hydrolase family hydrolase